MTTNSANTTAIAGFFGKLYSFNESLKLYHWHYSGPGSYAQHMATDEAVDSLLDALDGLVETSYALYGDLEIVIPETKRNDKLDKYISDMYDYVETNRGLFSESFTQGILDGYQEILQQLKYKIVRLR